jgi:type IV pilus assembly protein PilA
MLIGLVMSVAAGIILGAAGVGAGGAQAVVALSYLAIFAVQIVLTVRRAHDFDTTGWLALIALVPLVGLIFLFIPGTKGENRFGKPPPPNSVGVIILACLLPLIAVVGILAAIAIPAYQDYTIRAQVSEGLVLAAPAKVAVADSFSKDGAAPEDRESAGLPADATAGGGKYAASVDVVNGTVVVTYGRLANAQIAGKSVAIQPYVMPDKTVVWRCGMAAPPAGAVAMDDGAPHGTDIPPRYLPSACRA